MQIMRERFLAIDMLSELHRGQSDGRVHVIGRGDIDGIDVLRFLFEQFAPVLIDPRVRELFAGFGGPVEIHITDRDDLDILAVGDLGEVGPSLPTCAEAGVAEGCERRAREEIAGDKRGACGRGAKEFEKRPARIGLRMVHGLTWEFSRVA